MGTFSLLICNGEPPGKRLAGRLARKAGYIIAADGGANAARRLGIRPDVIIGDLDSVTSATQRTFSDVLQVKVARQDNTDLEKALDFLAARRRREVVILGATGRRIDFTLANVSVIWRYTRSMSIVFAGDGWRAMPVVGRLALHASRGTTVSLLPFGPCSGITLKGLRYPLTNAAMRVGEVGVSNVVLRSPCLVSVKRGRMLAVVLDNRAGNMPAGGEW